MTQKTQEETIIKIPNSNRFIALEPTLEELTQEPTAFKIILIDPKENEPLGAYKFRAPKKSPYWTKYNSSKIISNKPNSQVPQDLIKAATTILQEIANTQKQKNPHYSLEHKCNFYLMKSCAMQNGSLEKVNKILNLYKQNNYEFKTELDATRTY